MSTLGARIRAANPILLVVGVVAVVVAIVGLFVRASPGLSGAFLAVGAALLVLSVFEPHVRNRGEAATEEEAKPDIDLALVERHARAAEAEVARGQLFAVGDMPDDLEGAEPVRAFVSQTAAKQLRREGADIANVLSEELQALPSLEEASRRAPIDELPAGYRSLVLPSGYIVVYRRLTPVEINQATGAYTEEDAYLVADLLPVLN
jgi:hypothetical protein